MASLFAGSIARDQNLNVHFNGVSVGKPNVPKSQRSRGLGTRKPLGDLSNAASTPASTLVSKKQNSKAVSKDEGKALKTGRKALSDISNSGRPHSNHASKKNQNTKLSSLCEESIADERFLHNHNECIKAQTKAVDMDEFLKTIGLENGLHRPLTTSPLSSKSKFDESHLKYLELDEMDEPSLEDQFMLKTEMSYNLQHSPPHCITPKSASRFVAHPWDCNDSFSFMLTETPKFSRH